MAKFEAGADPANHTNAEVVEFLTGNDCTPDEYDRVMTAEREGRNRVGILNGSGAEEASASETAGPNEAATGQESPADQASDVADPQASGDAGTTAEPYPGEAPAALGPEKPQSEAEELAHAQTIANQAAATQTPAEALAKAAELSQQWKTNH